MAPSEVPIAIDIDPKELEIVLPEKKPPKAAPRAPKGPLQAAPANAVIASNLVPSQRSKRDIPQSSVNEEPPDSTDGPINMDDYSPIVQFMAPIFYCTEDSKIAKIVVMRMGNLWVRSEVPWTTRDGSALAGSNYMHKTGTIVFNPGDEKQVIEVALIDDDTWDTTLEFMVDLEEEGTAGATLGRYLRHSRVKLIDDDAFPTNRYRKQVLAGDLAKVNSFALLIEYFRMNIRRPGIMRGTLKMMAVDQLHNLYLTMQLYLNVYLVDFVLAGVPEERLLVADRQMNLVLMMGASVFVFAVLFYFDYTKFNWKVGGRSRNTLQEGLIRKFLNYDEVSRPTVKQGDITMAVTRDAADLVQNGYLSFLAIMRALGQLAMILMFQLTAPFLFEKEMRYTAFVCLVGFPTCLLFFLILRRKSTTLALDKKNHCQDMMVEQMNSTFQNYRLIADYNQRPFFVDKFETMVQDFNKASTAVSKSMEVNEGFVDWLTVICVAAYTFIGGMSVIRDPEKNTLGMFLTDLRILSTIGSSWGAIYSICLKMETIFPALERITKLLNLSTDVMKRKELTGSFLTVVDGLVEERTTTRTPSKSTTGSWPMPFDDLPLKIENLVMPHGKARFTANPVLIQQGQFVSIIGNRGEGKSTLLKLFGSVILPNLNNGAYFFMPPHVRALYVSSEKTFFTGTLQANLGFGVKPGDEDGKLSRVLAICRSLNLPQETISWVQEEIVLDWGEVLSQTQRSLLCLARALITNPEILINDKPTEGFNEEQSLRILRNLRDFVIKKGVEQDADTWWRRRPRTCIMSTSQLVGISHADKVFHISRDIGVRVLDKSGVTPDMLG
eukprot:gnl/TRDRNA2_/TRDRNA2_160484_c1_seq1.p1 gnl/TRDRNA2_/TRDRNA2_160484_c1~~gnl/TRDRNA2_/TRDRNA2_160484_c1_seq1.p1  ORF type:complete len:921 (+),score=142.22 gnl/TRDRNA2_/TRDRNA2_160484_c1_seq1:258-2765(+)